jgi:putative two-component system response regulator
LVYWAADGEEEEPMAATILLVDADSSNRTDWEALLDNQGYRVFAAENGKAALEECPRLQPDLVLLHTSLPDISGFEVCRRLKADPLNRLTPVVLMSPLSNATDAWRGQEAGADDFWGRPASRWEALSRVQSILQMKSYIDDQAAAVTYSLARSIEARDPTTEGHSQRVVEFAVGLGESLGLSQDDLQALRVAGLVHDIGKVAVPDDILLKPGRLTPEETAIMQQHPVVGENICEPLKSFRRILPIIRHHHERIDGSGYPDGLRGERIPLHAHIVQIADIYDALTSNRPYREALSPCRALEILSEEAGRGWLDQDLVNHFSWSLQSSQAIMRRRRSILADSTVV